MSFPSTRTEQSISNSSRAAMPNRAVFFASIAALYTTAIIAATLTLHPYFSQTWDVQTFIQAGKQFLDGKNPFALYAESRAAQTWPFAYPPLHAFVTALALALGNLFHVLPDYVWARVPTIIADIGIAILLYTIVRRKSNDEQIARAAAMLWLFNPITFYDTAVQGHFESEWLIFVLLAYVWFDAGRSIILPTIALAMAVLFKQVAIVFVIPIWIALFFEIFRNRRLTTEDSKSDLAVSRRRLVVTLISSIIIFAFIIIIVCLPYLLYSSDFLFMNLTYVENVPVQTQSWIVAVLGLTRDAPNVMTSDFFLLRSQTIVTMFAAIAISFIGARRGWSLYQTATLIALAFFLTSKKVMGYYYVMLLPFLLTEFLPRNRFDLVTIALVATTYISLSPYHAAWTNHAHWWVYAILGILNSAFFVWLGKKLMDDQRPATAKFSAVGDLQSAVITSAGLFTAAVFASLLQPFIGDNGSPIRAPIIAAGMEMNALAVFAGMIMLLLAAIIVRRHLLRATDEIWTISVPLIFAPLFFSVYTLTKESTAIFEIALKALGV
jgi:Gpi18-like mannosyltransferase